MAIWGCFRKIARKRASESNGNVRDHIHTASKRADHEAENARGIDDAQRGTARWFFREEALSVELLLLVGEADVICVDPDESEIHP